MTSEERGEMISRLKMAKNLRDQIKIEAELNDITADEVKQCMTEAGIALPEKKQGHTPEAAEVVQRIREGALLDELAEEYGVRGCHITKKLRYAGYDMRDIQVMLERNTEARGKADAEAEEAEAENEESKAPNPAEDVSALTPVRAMSIAECAFKIIDAIKALRRCAGEAETEIRACDDSIWITVRLGGTEYEVNNYGE